MMVVPARWVHAGDAPTDRWRNPAMTVELTMPPTARDALAYRATGSWIEDVAPSVATLAAAGERSAILDRHGAMSYLELASATERLASTLHGCGVRTGDAIVVVTDNDRESVVACHASWTLGAVAVLVHRSSGASEVTLACKAVSPSIVLLAPGAEPLPRRERHHWTCRCHCGLGRYRRSAGPRRRSRSGRCAAGDLHVGNDLEGERGGAHGEHSPSLGRQFPRYD